MEATGPTTLPAPIDEEAIRTLVRSSRPSGKRRLGLWLAVGALLLGAVGGGVAWAASRKHDGQPRYETAEVTRGELRVAISATGTVQGVNTVQVGAEVSGRLSAVHVDFNDQVEVGQLLAEIDPEQLEAAVEEASARVEAARASGEQARANLQEAGSVLARAEEQHGKGLVSSRELEAARAGAARGKAGLASSGAEERLARASLATARSRLGKTRISSPIKGVVLSRLVDPGQTVTAGFQTPVLFKLAQDLHVMSLHVFVDEADVGRVHGGEEASFTVDAYPDRTFPSKVTSLRFEPRTEQNVVSYEAVLKADNPELLLRPGMTATATIVAETRTGVLLVPNAALRFKPAAPARPAFGPRAPRSGTTGPQLYVPGSPEPKAVPVRKGPTDGKFTEVVGEELTEGMKVIVDVAEEP